MSGLLDVTNSTKERPQILHLQTFFAFISSMLNGTNYSQKSPVLIIGEKKGGYLVGSFAKNAQVYPVFSRQNYTDVKMGCAEAYTITQCLYIYDLMCSYG
ncbi:hypothetical protein EMCRGX_G025145 [Ephydatia muelleri]